MAKQVEKLVASSKGNKRFASQQLRHLMQRLVDQRSPHVDMVLGELMKLGTPNANDFVVAFESEFLRTDVDLLRLRKFADRALSADFQVGVVAPCPSLALSYTILSQLDDQAKLLPWILQAGCAFGDNDLVAKMFIKARALEVSIGIGLFSQLLRSAARHQNSKVGLRRRSACVAHRPSFSSSSSPSSSLRSSN